MDDPDHRKMRALTQAWFMPANVAKLRTMSGDRRTEIDAMRRSAGSATSSTRLRWVIRCAWSWNPRCATRDEPRMLKLTQEIFGPEDPELNRNRQNAPSAEQRAVCSRPSSRISERTQNHHRGPPSSAQRRRDRAGKRAAGREPLSDRHLTSYYMIIATAGHDTTSSTIGTAMWHCASFRGCCPNSSGLIADPGLHR